MHQVKKAKKHKFKPGNKQGHKPQNAFAKNNQGQKNNNWQQSHGKRKQPSSESTVPPPKKPFQGHGQHTMKIDPSTCIRCGDTRHRSGFSCPAAKYHCKAYSKVGHFTSRCLTKPKTVNQITQDEESAYLNAWQDDSNYFICQIRDQKTITKWLYANLPLVQQCHHHRRTYLRARIDPGADVNVMPATVYKQLTGDTELKNLGPVKCTMRVYTTEAIKNLGSLKVFVKYPGQKPELITFNITDQQGSVLLSCEDVLKLHLITPKPDLEDMVEGSKLIASQADINQIRNTTHEQESPQELPTPQAITCKEDIRKYFPDVIDGLGTFPGKPYHINIDPSVPPKRLPARPVPIHQQAEFKGQLQEMLGAGVIVPVTEPTPWINSFVIVETMDKLGNIRMRICLNPTPLNKAVIRESYHSRSPDDIYHHLCNAKHLTVVDFRKHYWQCLLDEESSYLTTFNTPYGCFRFVRIPFGVNVSGDAVQRKTDEIYNTLPNVLGIADDIIIWGDKEDGSDHDEALARFLQVTRENGLRINFDKIQYKTTEVTFFGETYSTKGHKPATDKVQAITQMPTPSNVTKLQTLLGMCQCLAKYSPRIAELSEPLRQLTCKGIPFVWVPEHDEAFAALKQEITTAPTLRYYDPSKPLTIQTDACTKGLGAALLQEGQPVYFASKSLTKAHQNYVAIELEMLAVCWALKNSITTYMDIHLHCRLIKNPW